MLGGGYARQAQEAGDRNIRHGQDTIHQERLAEDRCRERRYLGGDWDEEHLREPPRREGRCADAASARRSRLRRCGSPGRCRNLGRCRDLRRGAPEAKADSSGTWQVAAATRRAIGPGVLGHHGVPIPAGPRGCRGSGRCIDS